MTDKVTQACPSGCQSATMMLNAAEGWQVRYVQCGCGWRSQEFVDQDGAVAEQKALAAWNHRTNTELVEALREIAEPVPAEFEARGDPESGRVGKFYKAGRFDRAQDIARKALSLYGDER
jgi:hypothetical protein